MNVHAVSIARPGATAASAEAEAVRRMARKQKAAHKPAESDLGGLAHSERVRARDKDRYDPGEAAYVARTQVKSAPSPHPRAERSHHAEPRRSGRA
jgi:hypothetical protein